VSGFSVELIVLYMREIEIDREREREGGGGVCREKKRDYAYITSVTGMMENILPAAFAIYFLDLKTGNHK
jgi:hypothetical protein